MDKYDVIIVGGGPAGLACAGPLAAAGAKVLLLERKKNLGRKVCAGGITWHGLIRRVPEHLIERSFTEQHIFSSYQKIRFSRPDPVIATVNREALGLWMRDEALASGAQIRSGWQVRQIEQHSIIATDDQGRSCRLRFEQLVGADGSSSIVRHSLGLPTVRLGIGINYQVPGYYEHMEWHLDTKLFGNGYGWIFPHGRSISIGAYRPRNGIPPVRFKKKLINWADSRGFSLAELSPQAELINYDYRGWQFERVWLVGDAAGFASGLTGEGINPAIISGQAAARKITDSAYPANEIRLLLRKKAHHERIIGLTAGRGITCTLLMEMLVIMLRLRLLDFQKQLSM